MILARHDLPVGGIGIGDGRIARGFDRNLGQFDPRRERQEQIVDFGAADHHRLRRIGKAQRFLDAGDGFGAFLLPARVAGEDDVAPPLQHRGQAVEGLAPHDHRAAHGKLFEAAQVGGQVPGNLAARTDHAIGGACKDQRDIRAVHRGEAPTQVTWPSLRPSRTSVLP